MKDYDKNKESSYIQYWHVKIIKTERRINYLVSEPNYYTTRFFTEKVLAISMKRTEVHMNKPAFRSFNTRIKLNINVLVLVWLYKTKI